MKRRLSRLAAFALTLVAVCAMVIVPASADGQTMTFNKETNMVGGTTLPEGVEFAFTITPGVASTDSAFPVSAGVGTPTIDTATFAAGSNGGTQAVTVDFSGVTFPAPGVYRYIITETASNLPGFTNDENATRYLDVVVTADGSYRYNLLPSATSFDGDGNYSGTKSDGFTNTFKAHNFAFSKNVDGNVGDHNKTFEFTLNITGALPGTYTVTSSDIEGAPTTITVDAEGNYTGAFNLKHGSSFSIAGLNEGAVCAVSEDEDGYEASYKVNNGDAVTDNSYPETALTADTTVDFTNSLSMSVPTGVLLTIAPFAVGLFLFGALAVFFVARKRQYEE